MDERERGSQPPVIILDHFSFALSFVSFVDRGSFPTGTGAIYQKYKFNQYGVFIGDCHANQSALNNQMSGNNTCTKCAQQAPDWFTKVFQPPSEVPSKSISDNQEWFRNGAAGAKYHDLAAIFLNDSETPLKKLWLDMANVNSD